MLSQLSTLVPESQQHPVFYASIGSTWRSGPRRCRNGYSSYA